MTHRELMELLVEAWQHYRVCTSDGRYVAGGIRVIEVIRQELVEALLIDENGRTHMEHKLWRPGAREGT